MYTIYEFDSGSPLGTTIHLYRQLDSDAIPMCFSQFDACWELDPDYSDLMPILSKAEVFQSRNLDEVIEWLAGIRWFFMSEKLLSTI